MRKWLIRTNNNQIFGPVSKQKLIEFYNDKTISLDDEVCSGNGFWFYIREQELLEKFLLGEVDQPFNPISEAKDVLDLKNPDAQIGDRRSDSREESNLEDFSEAESSDAILPDQEDLEFPDTLEPEDEEDQDITLVKSLSAELLNLQQDNELAMDSTSSDISSSHGSHEPDDIPLGLDLGSDVSATLNQYDAEADEVNDEEDYSDEEALYPADADLSYPEEDSTQPDLVEEPITDISSDGFSIDLDLDLKADDRIEQLGENFEEDSEADDSQPTRILNTKMIKEGFDNEPHSEAEFEAPLPSPTKEEDDQLKAKRSVPQLKAEDNLESDVKVELKKTSKKKVVKSTKSAVKVKPGANKKKGKKQKDDRYLMYLVLILVMALGYIVVKKKDLIDNLFSYIQTQKVHISLVASAHAQEVVTPEKKTSKIDLEAIETPEVFEAKRPVDISIKRNILGPTIEIDFNPKSSCELLNNEIYVLTFLIGNSKSLRFENCQNINAGLFKIFEIKNSVINNIDDLEIRYKTLITALKEVFPNSLDEEFYKKITLKHEQDKKLYSLILNLNKYIESKEVNRQGAIVLLESIDNFPRNLILDLYKVAIFYKVFNKGRASRLLKEIWKTDPLFYSINYFPLGGSNEFLDGLKISDTLLGFLETKLNDTDKTFTFTYLSKLWPDNKTKKFHKDISLQEIREFTRSFKKGARYPALWREDLANRSANKDIQSYIEQVWDYHAEINEFNKVLWTMKYHTPSKQTIRQRMILRMQELSTSKDPYEIALFLEILENEEVYNFLRRREIITKPLFLLKRQKLKFLRDELNLPHYSSHHLFLQGEKNLKNTVLGMFIRN